MKLSKKTLTTLAEMVCGADGGSSSLGFGWENFPYRSSTYLTEFFVGCDLDYTHDGSTRKYWVLERLEELNALPASHPQLPSDTLIRVIQELLDPISLKQWGKDSSAALSDVNLVLSRDSIQVYIDGIGKCHLRNDSTQITSAQARHKRMFTPEEMKRRKDIAGYLNQISEDEFIEDVLVPLFGQLGFERISVTGHKDRSLEYGNDLWMKYQLPTSHFLYFSAQVKKGKLDSAGKSKGANANIAEVLNQINMLLRHPIWDPEMNKRVLVDHVFIISADEITKAAKNWLGEHLDIDSRRQIMFMDRDEILDLAVSMQLRFGEREEPKVPIEDDDDLPF